MEPKATHGVDYPLKQMKPYGERLTSSYINMHRKIAGAAAALAWVIQEGEKKPAEFGLLSREFDSQSYGWHFSIHGCGKLSAGEENYHSPADTRRFSSKRLKRVKWTRKYSRSYAAGKYAHWQKQL